MSDNMDNTVIVEVTESPIIVVVGSASNLNIVNEITTSTSTDITGILKGTGLSITQAIAGTDYLVSTAPGIQAFLTTPSSANLSSTITGETGSGALVFGTSPTFTNNITCPLIKPSADSTTAIQITKADGLTAVLTVDSTNTGLGIGSAPSATGAVTILKTGAGDRTGIYTTAQIISADSTYSSGIDTTVINSGSGTVASAYGVRANVQNTGAGIITDGIGVKINDAVSSGAGSITNQYGLFIANQTKGTAVNTGIHLMSNGVGCGISWGNNTNIPDTVLYQYSQKNLYCTANNMAIGGTPASAFQNFVLNGAVSSTSLALGLYFNTTFTATQNSASMCGLYIAPVYNDNGYTGVKHYSIYCPTNAGVAYIQDTTLLGTLTNDGINQLQIGGGFSATVADAANAMTLNSGTSKMTVNPYLNATYGGTLAITDIAVSYYLPLSLFASKHCLMSGNVLINTTTDDTTNKLQVNGAIKSTQFKLNALNTAPSSPTDTGTLGEIRVTDAYIYVCTATDTWVRTGLSSW